MGFLEDILFSPVTDPADIWGVRGEEKADRASKEAQLAQENAITLAMEEERRAREAGQGFLSP